MRRFFYHVFIVFIGLQYIGFSNDYLSNELIVKIQKEYFDKNQTNDFSELRNFLDKFLGTSNFSPFFNPKLIDYGLRKYQRFYKNEGDNPLSSLRRVFVIKYNDSIDPMFACQKLQNSNFFDYVQPFFLSKITKSFNDPRIEEQYYLRKIKAFEAWDILSGSNDTIVVGIVDTGVDIDHEDLQSNIFINTGEFGLDSLGNEKSNNRLDDDGNGYIDDFQGWDFAGRDGQTPDNNPRPGNGHGTHVAGIIGAICDNQIGVAGIVPRIKILPVKSASDEPFNTFITRGYDGILYAGIMGAKVINCSWGSEYASDLENDVIRAVNSLGACVVAAAGNDGKYSDFAPASLNGVLSVAAVDSNDIKAGFSNYSSKIDVSAPGVKVLSSTPGNTYAAWDGTSMASPVAAGVVALARLKFPFLNPQQIYELIKKQSDDIDSLNPLYTGLIGSGRVNALKTLNCNPDTIRTIILDSYKVTDLDGNGLFFSKDTIKLSLRFKNIFSDLFDVYVSLPDNIQDAKKIKSTLYVGNIPKFSEIEPNDFLLFSLAEGLPFDYLLKIPILVFDTFGYVSKFIIELQVNPSYRTMSHNNISISFNSRGNIGFNDYPQNKQGLGFIYKTSPNLLFEGGLLVAYDKSRVYDVVRSSNQSRQSTNFVIDSIFNVNFDPNLNSLVGKCSFKTNPDSLLKSDFYINCMVLQPTGRLDSNIVFVNYKVQNNTSKSLDSLFVGLFFDWDLGISGQNDFCVFDLDYNFAYTYNRDSTKLPFVGIKVLNQFPINFYAIDNDGKGNDSVGIYDGFTKSEKWMMLTGGIKRKQSRPTDASMVISAGPINVKQDSAIDVSFALFAGEDIFSLRKAAIHSQNLAYDLKLIYTKDEKKHDSFEVTLYPNPSDDDFTLRISFLELVPIEITINDNSGKLIQKFSFIDNIPWTIEKKLGLNKVSSGNYYISIKSPFGERTFLLSKFR